jgi:hypothetical protein
MPAQGKRGHKSKRRSGHKSAGGRSIYKAICIGGKKLGHYVGANLMKSSKKLRRALSDVDVAGLKKWHLARALAIKQISGVGPARMYVANLKDRIHDRRKRNSGIRRRNRARGYRRHGRGNSPAI